MELVIEIRLILLIGALVLSAFNVVRTSGKDPLSWAVLFLAVALLLQ